MSPASSSHTIFERVSTLNTLLYSLQTFAELQAVLARPKFRRLGSENLVQRLLQDIEDSGELITPTLRVTDCRDPKDNIFLELALSGRADLILTGDADLLTLHPWRTIPILTPADYLAQANP